ARVINGDFARDNGAFKSRHAGVGIDWKRIEDRPMNIGIGDRLPNTALTMATPDGPKPTTVEEVFAGKRAVLFAVPGAFTPTCSARHLPWFLDKAVELKAKGIDLIACVAVNDAFVMRAW